MAIAEIDPFLSRGYYEPRYNLEDQEISALSNELITDLMSEGLSPDSKFVCAELGASSKYANLARTVEETVFNETFGNTSEVMHIEYGPYENASKFWLVLDTENATPVGALRVIENSEYGLKTLNDINGEPLNFSADKVCSVHGINPDTTWDVGTVAVLPEYRGVKYSFLPSLSLYRALYARSVELGIEHYVTILDKKAKSDMDLLGIPFKPILDSDGFSYLGSEVSYALYAPVDSLAPGVDSRKQQVAGGKGLKALIYQSTDILLNGTSVDDARAIIKK